MNGSALADSSDLGKPPAARSIAASTFLAGVMGTGFSLTVIDAVRQSNGSREVTRKNATDGVSDSVWD